MSVEDKDDKLRGAFYEAFDQEGAAPPEQAWENIRASVLVKDAKKRRGGWYWFFALVLLVGTGSSWMLMHEPATPQKTATNNGQTLAANTTSHITTDQSSTANAQHAAATGKQETVSSDQAVSGEQGTGNREQAAKRANKMTKQRQAAASQTQGAMDDRPLPTKRYPSVIKGGAPSATGTQTGATSDGQLATPQGAAPANDPTNALNDRQPAPTAGEAINAGQQATVNTNPATETTTTPANNDTIHVLPFKALQPWIVQPPLALAPRGTMPLPPAKPFTRWQIECYLGGGENVRKVSGNFEDNFLSENLLTRDVRLVNRFVGANGSYRFTPWFSVQTGIGFGKNTYTTPWFYKLLEKKETGESYDFTTADGDLRMSSSDVNAYFEGADSVLFRVRLHHNSSYLTVPLTMKFTLPTRKLSPYLRLGVSYDLQLRNRTTLRMIADQQTSTVRLVESNKGNLQHAQVLIGLGFETPGRSNVKFFLEPQLSLPISTFYKMEDLKIASRYMQMKVGISFSF